MRRPADAYYNRGWASDGSWRESRYRERNSGRFRACLRFSRYIAGLPSGGRRRRSTPLGKPCRTPLHKLD